MLKKIISSLGIDVVPRWLITHSLIMSFILGGLNALFFITALGGFITEHYAIYFPEAIALSGAIGIILFNSYKYLYRKFSNKTSLILFSVLLGFVISIPFVFHQIPIAFALFVLWFPITLLNEKMFYKITNQFPLVKEKQNFKRFLEAGIICGTVFFSFFITALTKFNIHIPFLISALSCLVFVLIDYLYLNKKLEIKEDEEDEEEIDSLTSLISDISLKKTIFATIIFSLLSVITYVIIDFTFISVLDIVYSDIKVLTMFLGVFFGALMIVNLLFKLFVYQNLIKTFQISRAILFSPSVMFLLLIGLIALLLIPGQSEMRNPYALGFLLILFSRFFSFLLRESFELSSIRLLMAALETYGSKAISRSLTGVLTMWAILFGGLVLLLVKSLEIHALKTIIFLNCSFAFIWIIVALWLAHNYDSTISKIIKKLSSEIKNNESEKLRNFKDRVMITTNLSGLRYLLNYQRNYQPHNFQKTIELIPDNIQSKLGLTAMDESFKSDSYVYNNYNNNPQTEKIHFYDADENNKVKIIEVLVTSPKIKDRIRAVRLIESSGDMKYSNILKMLLQDNDDEVKRNAIMAVAKYHNSSLINELIEFLNHDEFSDLISDIFAEVGYTAVEPLSSVFNRRDIDFKSQCRIVKIIGKIESKNGLNFLLDKLNYPNKWLVFEVVKALNEIKYKSGPKENNLVNRAVKNTVGAAAWLLSMDVSLESINRFEPVRKALEEEFQVTMDLLFNVLQLKHSDGIISLVKKNILNNADNEQREICVEILGSILDEEIKPYLFPLLHNNQKNEKVIQLQQFFPIARQNPDQALREIINTDLGYVSLWTKACALKAYTEIEGTCDSEDVVAQTFNPEPLLFEMAFCSIYKWNKKKTVDLYNRLPDKQKKHLQSILSKGKNFEYQLLFNKVLSLQNISFFEKVKGHHLIPFAEILVEQYMSNGDNSFVYCSDEDVLPVFTVPFGEVLLVDLHKRSFRLNKNSLYGLGLYTGGITLKANSDSVIYRANPEQIGTLVINHEELSEALYKYIQSSNFY